MASVNVYDKSTRDSEDWYDDVGQNLDTFVRLSKAGHFRRANQYYHDVLEHYSDQIAVVASYADSLIDQGAFHKAESLLLASLEQYRGSAHEDDNGIEAIDIQDHEICVLNLLLAFASLYTRCNWQQACVLVERVQNTLETLHIDSEMPPLQLQIAVLSLRLTDLLLRMSHYDRTLEIKVKLESPFRANTTSPSRLSWAESIVALLKHDYLWEAQTIYMMILRYPTLQTQIPFAHIIRSIPEEDDSMYTLVTLTMLAGSVLSMEHPLQVRLFFLHIIGLGDDWRKTMCRDVTQLTRPIESTGISIANSRAFALALLVCLASPNPESDGRDELATLFPAVGSKWLPEDSCSWTVDARIAGIENMRTVAAEHDDYMFSLVTCEASNLPLPEGWLEKTGASRLAIRCLHHKARLEEMDDDSLPLLAKVAAEQDSPVAEAARSLNHRGPVSGLSHTAEGTIALSIPGLFITCVQYFALVQLGREFTKNFGSCLLRLRGTEIRLCRWGRAAGITDERSETFVKQLQHTYTPQEIGFAHNACKQIAKQLRRAKEDSDEMMDMNHSLEDLHDVADELQRMEIYAPEASHASWALKSVKTNYGRSLRFTNKAAVRGKWALYEEKELIDLLTVIGEHIATLEKLFPQQERDLAIAEATKMERDAIEVLAPITITDDPILAEALRSVAPRKGFSWNEIVSTKYAMMQLGNTFRDPHADTGPSRWDDSRRGNYRYETTSLSQDAAEPNPQRHAALTAIDDDNRPLSPGSSRAVAR